MSLELISFTPSRSGFIAKYEVTHRTSGPNGMVLSQFLTMNTNGTLSSCTMSIDECKASTPDESLDRMATWLRRLAEGIETRKPSTLIPLS